MDIPSLFQRVSSSPCFESGLHQLTHQPSLETPVVWDHTDVAGVGFAVALALHSLPKKERAWVVAPNQRIQELLYTQLQTWGIPHPVFIPEQEETVAESIQDPEIVAERLNALQQIESKEKDFQVVLVTDRVLDQEVPIKETGNGHTLELSVGMTISPSEIIKLCTSNGFEETNQVITRGQWSQRGGIIDIFPLQTPYPIRIEFFDEEIESLREFDIDSQISFRKPTSVVLLFRESSSTLPLRHLISGSDKIITTPGSSERGHLMLLSAPADDSQGIEDFSNAITDNPLGFFDAGDFVMQEMKRNLAARQLSEWMDLGCTVAIFFPNSGEEDRFKEICSNEPVLLKAERLRGDIPYGFTIPIAKLAVLSSAELFGRYQSATSRRRANREEQSRKMRSQNSLREISPGDLVVHTTHGIGKFIKIAPSEENGDEEMQILFRNNTILHVPLMQAHLVSRYIGLGNKTPELSKLGDAKWAKAKNAAEKAVLDYAAQMLDLQAKRKTGNGFKHPPDNHWMWEFENSFPFKETPDQLRAISQTKADMESERPMDRLICGDVGFGKTEVAIRAAFKCVTGGNQVAVLVPTTVLAEQHLRSFRSRMSEYPVRIEMLSRFTGAAEVKRILHGLANGSVDIVIGTHRLVSSDVHFKNLGLVVIDEEQRFGVKHKEKFKELFQGIDVLTLSATPIPRTLYLALMGARDMSTIETPPVNRLPVQTSVCPYDERIIRQAITNELDRGGQVFFLHNRVKTIELFRDKLLSLVPKARIVIGHGQMPKNELEEVMRDFVHGKADILLSTTIIESGIDIPNANTIIIDRADRFGLADLYQLRGRVGRSGTLAYAYLMLPRSSMTTEDARKRVSAIRQYSELGAGFKVAMRDLEIRGAGNLLGTQQSGHIAAIGFDLYCQLLRQSIERLQGKTVLARIDASLKADFLLFSESAYASSTQSRKNIIGAYVPISYMADSKSRIEAYKELARAQNTKEIDAIEIRWRDRFGILPDAVSNLLICQKIKILASQNHISQVEVSEQRLMLSRNGDYILLSGKFPRLSSSRPTAKLKEVLRMLETL
jgi:transcription-repair coupling factor (superfamily II helicase)